MIAQLQDGRLGAFRILQAATVQNMHRQHFTNDQHMNGMIYGFAEMTLNCQRLLVDSGTTNDEVFSSLLALPPTHIWACSCRIPARAAAAPSRSFCWLRTPVK